MSKGYWIVRVTVNDPDSYPEYLEAAQAAFEKYDARFLVRGGKAETVEGQSRERNVVVEFKDHATAVAATRVPSTGRPGRSAKNMRRPISSSSRATADKAAMVPPGPFPLFFAPVTLSFLRCTRRWNPRSPQLTPEGTYDRCCFS